MKELHVQGCSGWKIHISQFIQLCWVLTIKLHFYSGPFLNKDVIITYYRKLGKCYQICSENVVSSSYCTMVLRDFQTSSSAPQQLLQEY